MKLSNAVKAVVFTGALTMIGCQEVRPASPTAASLFIPDLAGIWSGPMTVVSVTGGECTKGAAWLANTSFDKASAYAAAGGEAW